MELSTQLLCRTRNPRSDILIRGIDRLDPLERSKCTGYCTFGTMERRSS